MSGATLHISFTRLVTFRDCEEQAEDCLKQGILKQKERKHCDCLKCV